MLPTKIDALHHFPLATQPDPDIIRQDYENLYLR
jgi:hypothetical protein